MKTKNLYAITGVTGQVGGAVARHLLAAGHNVRAVVRDAAKAGPWAEKGCEVALATMNDATALAAAFGKADGVFVLLPPRFDPDPAFADTREIIAAVHAALSSARPARVVVLSTIGAQAKEENLLSQLTLMEQALRALPLSVTFLRPAWFMENSIWDIAPARERGVVPSFLQPLDKAVPMVATDDVGRVAADLLQRLGAPGVVELEGPSHVTPNEIAATLAKLLHRDVRMEVLPRETWESVFRAQGATNPLPRMRMLDGFNEGWIEFGRPESTLKGVVTLETVLRSLIERA